MAHANIVEFRRSAAESLLAEILKQKAPDVELSVRIVDDDQIRVDIGIVIALKEEFKEIFPSIKPRPIPGGDVYYYLFNWGGNGSRLYDCVATFVGGMGGIKAALTTDRLVSRFSPATVINLGIAGSMSEEVVVGDVIVAEQADEYMYESKAIDIENGEGFTFKLSGDPYKSTPACVGHAKNLEFAHEGAINEWCGDAEQCLKGLMGEKERFGLLHKEILRPRPKVETGHIASSTIVGASEVFSKWLKDRDRKYLAIEMEAAGVLSATHGGPVETAIIRGISDFADGRKKEMDAIGGGALRKYAMRNALNILWTMMKLELLRGW
jgi:nucleoside phosphorylase